MTSRVTWLTVWRVVLRVPCVVAVCVQRCLPLPGPWWQRSCDDDTQASIRVRTRTSASHHLQSTCVPMYVRTQGACLMQRFNCAGAEYLIEATKLPDQHNKNCIAISILLANFYACLLLKRHTRTLWQFKNTLMTSQYSLSGGLGFALGTRLTSGFSSRFQLIHAIRQNFILSIQQGGVVFKKTKM